MQPTKPVVTDTSFSILQH